MQLYKISFLNSSKIYIGISSNSANVRLKAHSSNKNNSLIARAIRKHKNPILTILGECDDYELLCLAEQEAIEKFNTLSPNGYNLTLGGEGTFGFNHSKKSKDLLREKSIKQFSNPESREKARIVAIKQFSDPLARQKAKDIAVLRTSDPEIRKGISERAKKRLSNPIEAKRIAKNFNSYYENNPNARKEKSKSLHTKQIKIKAALGRAIFYAKKAGRKFSYISPHLG